MVYTLTVPLEPAERPRVFHHSSFGFIVFTGFVRSFIPLPITSFVPRDLLTTVDNPDDTPFRARFFVSSVLFGGFDLRAVKLKFDA